MSLVAVALFGGQSHLAHAGVGSYDALVDALGAGVAAHYKLAEASGATMAARIGGPGGAFVNTAAIEYRQDPLVDHDEGGFGLAFLGGAAPGHATIAEPMRSAAFTIDVALQLQHKGPSGKHIVAATGDAGPGSFSVEVVDAGGGLLRPRVWSVNGAGQYLIWRGTAGTITPGAGAKLTVVRPASGAMLCYVDGAPVALSREDATGATPGAWPATPLGATWYFGVYAGGVAAPLYGVVDELLLCNRALTAGEIGGLALARSNDWAPPAQTGLLVSDYGAVGNGSADDTAEIQACFDAAEAQGANVIFGAGQTYLVSAQLTLTDFNGTVYGNGATIMASGAMGATAGPNLLVTRGTGWVLDTLHLDGRRDLRGSAEAFGGHLVQVMGGSGGTLLNCNLKRGPTDNLRFAGVSQSNNATFPVDFTVSGGVNEDAGRLGIAVIEAFGGLIDGVTLRDIAKTPGYAPGCGIDLEPNSTSHVTAGEPQAVRDIEIRNCLIEDCRGGGIHITSAGNTVPTPNNTNIHHNTIRRCGGRVLSHGGNSYPPGDPYSRVSAVWSNGRLTYIQDNTIEADQTHVESDHYGAIALGIDMQGIQHVDRNTITLADAYDGNGIYVHGPSSGGLRSNGTGSTVTDNTIATGTATDAGIAKGRTSGWTYSGNEVDGVGID